MSTLNCTSDLSLYKLSVFKIRSGTTWLKANFFELSVRSFFVFAFTSPMPTALKGLAIEYSRPYF